RLVLAYRIPQPCGRGDKPDHIRRSIRGLHRWPQRATSRRTRPATSQPCRRLHHPDQLAITEGVLTARVRPSGLIPGTTSEVLDIIHGYYFSNAPEAAPAYMPDLPSECSEIPR